jgi:hypothetical protein
MEDKHSTQGKFETLTLQKATKIKVSRAMQATPNYETLFLPRCSKSVNITVCLFRMQYSGMWRRVDLVWTDVSGERVADCSHLLKLVPRSRIFLPWRWRRYVPLNRRFTQDLHGATSQKTAFFTVTAVKISDLTCLLICSFVMLHMQVWLCMDIYIYRTQ